jgi:dolichol-phosphate mannosyltransferase
VSQTEPAALESGCDVDISLVIPVYNEQECIVATLDEAFGVLERHGKPFEVIAVDDGSSDGTPRILAEQRQRRPALRVLRVSPNSGQSAAFGVGFRHSRGRTVVLMDADGQNDPADIPKLLDAMRDCDMCCGYRAVRRDTLSKRLGSRFGNAVRNRVLHDGIIDTGCSLKAVRSDLVRDLPMAFRGMHRFLPVLLMMKGARVRQIPVNHRPRAAGSSKYTNFRRLLDTRSDLWAVRWMQKRYRRFTATEIS